MKTKQSSIIRVPALGVILALAGCASVTTRDASLESSVVASTSDSVTANSSQPTPVHTVRPEYPWDLKRAGIIGEVNLRCVVDETGKVKDVTVANSTHSGFVKPAVEALTLWRFAPATRDG